MMYQNSLGASTIAYAKDNLGESDDVVKESVLAVQQFLRDNPNINARSDLRTILYFLRSCKFNVDQAEKKIKKYKYFLSG